jgi:hypothetical protein
MYAKLVSKIESLLGILREFSNRYPQVEVNTDGIMKNLISGIRAIGKAYLIDNLGLPEIYSLTKNFGYLNLSIKVKINRAGNTQTFKNMSKVNNNNFSIKPVSTQDHTIHTSLNILMI